MVRGQLPGLREGQDAPVRHRQHHPAPAEVQEVLALDQLCYSSRMVEPDSIVLEHLRHIRTVVDALRDDMREMKGRMGILENQYANLSARIDRLDARVERIERPLELADV